MKYKYRFDPIAANEYEAAYSWYTERSQKAAEKFITTVEEAIETICSNPHRFRKSYK
jgi:plasmid stabilization system protein ParE